MKYLAACITAKDEAPIIAEWIAFHQTVGFEHLIVIDNGSTDGMDKIVDKMRCETVTYISEPRVISQMTMYNNALKCYGHNYEWMAFIDADEFLFSPVSHDIKDVLSEYEGFSAVGVNWQLFGSSGHVSRPDGLVIENYCRRAENSIIHNHIKSIVRPTRTMEALTSHMFNVAGGTVNENGVAFPIREPYGLFPEIPASCEKLRINHYHVRSQEDYARKFKKGYFGDLEKLGSDTHWQQMWEAHDCNEVDDCSALAFAPSVRKQLAKHGILGA